MKTKITIAGQELSTSAQTNVMVSRLVTGLLTRLEDPGVASECGAGVRVAGADTSAGVPVGRGVWRVDA